MSEVKIYTNLSEAISRSSLFNEIVRVGIPEKQFDGTSRGFDERIQYQLDELIRARHVASVDTVSVDSFKVDCWGMKSSNEEFRLLFVRVV